MRVGVIAAVLFAWGAAAADPQLEASGFVGASWFGDTELGNSWAPEQVPGTAPLLGGRVAWLAAPRLFDGPSAHGELAVEAELAIATAFTGDAAGESSRMSYFAPVFAWRAHPMLRVRFDGLPRTALHALAGVGGATIASSSPFMSKETDPIAYWGLGGQLAISGRQATAWRLRLDARHGLMPGRASSVTSTFEIQLGVSVAFGLPVARAAAVRPPGRREPETLDDTDVDGDGLPDRLDKCPEEHETVNGLDDDDGCAEPDADGDGIIGDADKCPEEPEDFDRFSDEDGCPDRDNDRDAIEDSHDTCPLEAETGNGFADDDGCPDTIPDDVTKALDSVAAVRFEGARARVTPAARQVLQRVHALLKARTDLRIVIVGHPERASTDELAKRRAEAAKWDLVDRGIAEDRIETSVGAPGKPVLTIVLATGRR